MVIPIRRISTQIAIITRKTHTKAKQVFTINCQMTRKTSAISVHFLPGWNGRHYRLVD